MEKGDPETLLKKANDILWQFSMFLRLPNPTTEDLVRISNHISKELPQIDTESISYFERAQNFYQSHAIARDAIAVLVISGFCLFVGFIGINYFAIPSEIAWTAFWTLWGVLFVGYLNYVRKKK